MGIEAFDFSKLAGKKVSESGEVAETAEAPEAEAAELAAKVKARADDGREERGRAAAEKTAAASAEQAAAEKAAAEKAEKRREAKKAAGLEKYAKELGLGIPGLDIRFDDGVAMVTGTAPDQDTREKLVLAIGNTEGVARVEEEIAVKAPAPKAKMHAVVSGDTLSAIAQKYYGDASKYPVIFEANRPMLSNPDEIYPGQVLRIPPI